VYNEFALPTDWRDDWFKFIPNVPFGSQTYSDEQRCVGIRGVAMVTCTEIKPSQEEIELLASYNTVSNKSV
jgi:hypothetical protein